MSNIHYILACVATVSHLESNESLWKNKLADASIEETMKEICATIEVNCSSAMDDAKPKLRYIRDTIASDPVLSGCKMSSSLMLEILSMAAFWGALLLVQAGHLVIERIKERRREYVENSTDVSPPSTFLWMMGRMRVICERLATPWSWQGKVLGIIWSIFSVASFAFYLYQTYSHYRFLRFCQNPVDRIYAYVDLVFNIFFFFYFIIRYVASVNKASFLVSPNSLMEICTIGPSICTVINKDKHTLFNFLRAIRLAGIKDVLISFNIIPTATAKSLCSLIAGMFCFWSTLAGLIHLLENVDNFWWMLGPRVLNPCKSLTFFNSFYMLIITASTVGYGDFFPKTTLGQLTVMICIVVAGAYFLTSVPALMSIYFENRLNKKQKFSTGIGQRHIVLTGNIDSSTIRAFLTEFYLDSNQQTTNWNAQVKCCVLHACKLATVTQWLLYGMIGRVRPIRGSCANPKDLMDVKAFSSNAVIILSQLLPQDKNEDDHENYMRAMTVKLNFPHVRTIVQIHSFYNKFSYYYLTGWRNKSLRNAMWDLDTVICNDQIVNGLLGLNCIAPGFSSLVINLLCSAEPEKADVFQQYKWRTFYNFGRQANFHCTRFTRSFRGLTFKAACAIVYDRWGIILLGVSVDQANSYTCTNIINPSCDYNFLINPSIMKAFVICKNEIDLHRFETYCNYCKNKADGVCTCDSPAGNDTRPKVDALQRTVAEKVLRDKFMRKNALFTNKNNAEDAIHELINSREKDSLVSNANDAAAARQFSDDANLNTDCKWDDLALLPASPADAALEAEFLRALEPNGEPLLPADAWGYERTFRPIADVSGTLHWAPDRPCRLLDIEEANEVPWSGHVVLCILGEVSIPVGLSSLLLPLRSRLIELEQLCDVVVLGDADGLAEHEWRHVSNFRQVYFVRGSGLFTSHLICCRVHHASAAVVLQAGPPPNRSDTKDSAGNGDTGGLGIDGGVGGDGDTGVRPGQEAFGLADTDAVVCAENVRAVVIGRRGQRYYREKFNLTVRLSCPNAASFFSDLKERDKDIQSTDVAGTQAFAEGLVISGTQLAALVSATFHCPEVAQFLQALVQGSNQSVVDGFLASYIGMPSELDSEKVAMLSKSYPFRISQLTITEPPLRDMFDTFNSSTIYWEELYIRSLEKFGIICLGLYQLRSKGRLISKEKKTSGRFVYTFPSRRTIVDATDRVFCIVSGESCSRGAETLKPLKRSKGTPSSSGGSKTDYENNKLNKKYFDNFSNYYNDNLSRSQNQQEAGELHRGHCSPESEVGEETFAFNFQSPCDSTSF